MLKSGNGKPKQCVENLISIIRGEVAFDRVRGIDARIIDSPSEEARVDFEQDTIWNVETYEPRIDTENTEITVTEKENGGFALELDISLAEAPEQ